MKILKYLSLLFLVLLVAWGNILIPPKQAKADLTSYFSTNTDSHSGCYTQYQVYVYGTFAPGGSIVVNINDMEPDTDNNGQPCGNRINGTVGREFYAGLNGSQTSLSYTGGGASGTFTIPSSPSGGSDVVLSFSASVAFDSLDGTGYHRVSGSGAVTVYRFTTINVDTGNCRGTWSLIPGGYSSNPSYVAADYTGNTTYTLNYTPIAGETLQSISPASSQAVYPGNTYSFSLNCPASDPSVPQILSFYADPSTLSCPGATTVYWTTKNAVSCIGGWDPINTLPANGSALVYPSSSGSTNYGLTCQSATGNEVNANTQVDVSSATCGGGTSPTLSVTANPKTISAGSGSTVSWSSTNTDSCSAWWTTNTGTSGSATVFPSVTTPYSMTCTGPGGSITRSDTVTVGSGGSGSNGQISVQVTGTPASWTITGPTQTASGSGLAGGPYTLGASLAGTVYTLTPGNVAGYNWSVAAPGVNQTLYPNSFFTYYITYTSASGGTPTVNVTADASSINSGGSTIVRWSSTNADTCTSPSNNLTTLNPSGPTSGQETVSPSAYTIYIVHCSNSSTGLWDEKQVAINVNNPFTWRLDGPVPASQSTQQGSPGQVQFTETLVSGTSQAVNLSYGDPDGIIDPTQGASFSTCNDGSGGSVPTCSTTFTYNISPTAPTGVHNITVSGSPASTNGTVTLPVTVQVGNISGNGPTAVVPNPGKTGSGGTGGTNPETFTSCAVSGGSGVYNYSWYEDDTGTDVLLGTSSTNTFKYSFTTPGSRSVHAIVKDSINGSTVTCSSVPFRILLNANYQEF